MGAICLTRLPIDLLPKGVEIRTPVCDSIEECLASLSTLHQRLQTALLGLGYRAASLSHHPTETHFEGPQNKRVNQTKRGLLLVRLARLGAPTAGQLH